MTVYLLLSDRLADNGGEICHGVYATMEDAERGRDEFVRYYVDLFWEGHDMDGTYAAYKNGKIVELKYSDFDPAPSTKIVEAEMGKTLLCEGYKM